MLVSLCILRDFWTGSAYSCDVLCATAGAIAVYLPEAWQLPSAQLHADSFAICERQQDGWQYWCINGAVAKSNNH